MRIRLSAVVLAFAVTLGLDARAADLIFPTLSGRVVDEAGLLRPETEDRIEARLARLETDTGVQLMIATLADLQGREIEDYGLALGRHWGIGRRQSDNGALLLVAPRERRVRLEAGHGLEPVLNDALAARIIHAELLPAFRVGGFEAGILRGLAAGEAQLRQDPGVADRAAAAVKRPAAAAPVGPAVIVFLVFLFVFLGTLRAAEGRRRDVRRSGAGGGSVTLWRGQVGADDGDVEGGGASMRW